MLGLGLSFAKQTAKVFSFVKDQLKLLYRFYDNNPELLLSGATSFDGTDDYISIADSDSLSFGDGSTDSALTFSAWVKANDVTSFDIISKGIYNTSGEYRLFINSSNKLIARFMDESVNSTYIGREYSTGVESYENKWTHIVTTYDGSSNNSGVKIYINGLRVDNADNNAGSYVAMENLGANVEIGRNNTTYSDGKIANVGIWNRALSASEIESIYWKGQYADLKGTELTNLVSWYNLKDTPSEVGSELISVANDRTFDGSTTNWIAQSGASIAVEGGELKVVFGTGVSNFANLNNTGILNGSKYQISFDIRSKSGDGDIPNVDVGHIATNRSGINYLTVTSTETKTTHTGIITAVASITTNRDFMVMMYLQNNKTVFVDNISIKPIQTPDSTGTNNGTVVGATTLTDAYSASSPFLPRIQDKATPKGAVALASGSTSFATDDYINTGTPFSNTNHTISAWVNASATGGVVFDNRDANDDGIRLIYDSSLIYQLNSSDVSLSSPSLNTWHHIACTYDGTTQKLYLNGSLVASASTSQTISVSQNLIIGKQSYSDVAYFNGSIANVAIYSDAKTQSQIQDIMFSSYSTLTSELKTNLVSWYDLGSTELGSEKSPNVTFDSNITGWSGTNWAWESDGEGGGRAKHTAGSTAHLQSGNILTVGLQYEVSFTVGGRTAGSVFTRAGASGSGTSRTANGDYTEILTCLTNGIMYVSVSSDFDGYVDNVSFKPIETPDSQGDNEGSIYGATTNTGYTNSPSGVADPLNYGEVYGGNAVSFDGINDYIDCGTALGTDLGNNYSGSLSMSMWFKADTTSSNDGLFHIGSLSSASGEFEVQMYNNTLRFRLSNTVWWIQYDFTDTSSWHHLVCIYDTNSESNSKMYIDGVSVGSTNGTFPSDADMDFSGLKTIIGSFFSTSLTFDGLINNVKVFNTTLTQDQVRELYTKPELTLPTGVSSSALKLDMPMQEGSGVAILDGSGNQNHGTGNGITWATGQEYGFQHPLVRSNNPMVFDGSDDRITNSFDNLAQDATYSFWAKSSKTGSNAVFGHGALKKAFYFNFSSGRPLIYLASNYYKYWNDNSAQDDNQWHHYVVIVDVSDANGTHLYIDGNIQSVSSTVSSSPADAYSQGLTIGAQQESGSTAFDGIINEFAVWHKFLTANEITALYNSGLPLLPTADSGNYASADDLVGYWRNDGVTTWIDKANTGVASFDGTDDRLSVADSNSLEFGVGDFSFSFWMKLNSVSGTQTIFNRRENGSNSNWVQIKNTGYLDFGASYSGSSVIRSQINSSVVSTNQWYHIVWSVDRDSTTNIYINNVAQTLDTNTKDDGANTLDYGVTALIGAFNHSSPSSFLNGQLSSFNIFKGIALSATEVSELYAIDKRSSISGHSKFSNCVGSWLMGAGTGDTTSTIQDQTSNNNDATVSGANLIGYNDGTVAGDPASIIVPEGLNEGRDSQGYYLTDTDSISSGIRLKGAEYISVQDSESLSFGNGTSDSPFSLEAWIKPNDVTNFEIFAKGIYNSTGEYLFGFEADDKLKFYLFDESVASTTEGVLYNTALTSSEGQWMHIVGTYDGRGGTSANAGMKIYLNGSQVNNGTESAGTYVAMENLSANLEIGKYSSNYAKGSIDEAKVYSKELSASEVLKNYNNGKSAHSN